MKKISLTVFLVIAGVFIMAGLTACGANFGSGPGSGHEYVGTEMTKLPTKLTYFEGEKFDPSGLEVTEKERGTSGSGKTRDEVFKYDNAPQYFNFRMSSPVYNGFDIIDEFKYGLTTGGSSEVTKDIIVIFPNMHSYKDEHYEFTVTITVKRNVTGDEI